MWLLDLYLSDSRIALLYRISSRFLCDSPSRKFQKSIKLVQLFMVIFTFWCYFAFCYPSARNLNHFVQLILLDSEIFQMVQTDCWNPNDTCFFDCCWDIVWSYIIRNRSLFSYTCTLNSLVFDSSNSKDLVLAFENILGIGNQKEDKNSLFKVHYWNHSLHFYGSHCSNSFTRCTRQ